MDKLINSMQALKKYCEKEEYRGWDPYDGLNSKFFQATPLKDWDVARLVWIQGFKRSPLNLRKVFAVPKEYNAKGIGLFLSGYCNLYKIAQRGNSVFGSKESLLERIEFLSELLLDLRSEGYSGSCWGYNFDWQSRRLFLFPKNTPTVVATTFCATALIEAYEITGAEKYLDAALSSANFILNDLSRTPHKNGFLFSYSPLKGNDTVYNASLLGAKLLSRIYHFTKKEEYLEIAREAVMAACEGQEEDGSWVYGLLPTQQWKDSFHTGYNLDAVQVYQNNTGDYSFKKNIDKGLKYYLKNFFLNDGTPKYYNNKVYPIDIHCPGQLLVTLKSLDEYKANEALAKKVLHWSINNMQDKSGYFYYQLKKGISSKIPYMRWSNAFMFHAMSSFFYEQKM